MLGPIRFLAPLLLLSAVAVKSAGEAAPAPPVRPAVERGLEFLKKESYRWKAAKGCAACHHAAMVIWPANEAKARGYGVDEPALKELTAWAISNQKTNVEVPQAPPRDVINLGATYALLSLETAPAANISSPELIADRYFLLNYIAGQEKVDGSWGVPLDLRVPLGGPPEDIALLSRIALIQSGDTSTTTTLAVKKAGDWLDAVHGSPSRQGRNLRLWMALQEGKPAAEWTSVVAAIKAEQNADGGWSQTTEMPSDAYATGQTLYILSRSGVKPDDPQMVRGVEFLTRTQKEDGSWPMTSRVKSKDMTPITAAGAGWAVLGLLRASP